jgi:hypothetical protein
VSIPVRIGLAFLVGMVLSLLISEGAYLLSRDRSDRRATRIELVIPAGTAENVAAGEITSTIPESMTFVQGDTLVLINQDSVSHQLGAIWVPAGARGTLVLDEPSQMSFACTFRPDRYLGIDVRPVVTWATRLKAVLMIGLPTGALLAAYSFVFAGDRKKTTPAANHNGQG